MKKLTLLFTVFFVVLFTNAQNVAINNDGTSAASSAMLDVKSTTKGFMMPRVTSAQRGAITSPTLGLLVFDTDTKTIWAYDGNSWKNLYTSGGGLTLPFSQTVNTTTSALQVANEGAGPAIEGSSSTQFGIGITAKTTGEGGWGLFAFSNGAGSQSIRSYADNGTAFHGENNNAANTNTLMNLLNKGAGRTGSYQLANSSSTSPNVQIAGNHLGNQLKIYQTNTSNSEAAISIENSGTGTGIEATSTVGYGVKGVTNSGLGMAGVHGQNNGTAGSGVVGVSHAANTQGVYGSSQNGVAVRASGDSYRAVQATSNSGTALYGSSTTGYSLEINGNVKISGGNTNPSNGAVLTSDANGNAVWTAQQKVAFRATGINSTYSQDLATNVWYKVIFPSESYDFSNSFSSYSGSSAPVDASTFIVPVKGVYAFEAHLGIAVNGADYSDPGEFVDARIRLAVTRNGVTTYLDEAEFYTGDLIESSFDQSLLEMKISGDFYLYPGDKVFLQALHYNGNAAHAFIIPSNYLRFSGRLVIRD